MPGVRCDVVDPYSSCVTRPAIDRPVCHACCTRIPTERKPGAFVPAVASHAVRLPHACMGAHVSLLLSQVAIEESSSSSEVVCEDCCSAVFDDCCSAV